MMFCAFEGKPLTLRLHGRGEVIETHNPEFSELIELFPELPGIRSIIRLNIDRVADSCGWTVPLYEFAGTRDYLRQVCGTYRCGRHARGPAEVQHDQH